MHCAEDENTKVILGYIEGVNDGRKFMDVASEVSKKKPVIILKSGTTSAGAKAASSHTGALAGREAAFDAAFRQSGIIRAHTLNELFNYALAFALQPLPKGPHVAIITNSGGPGILAADACDKSDLQLVTLHKETIDKLRTSCLLLHHFIIRLISSEIPGPNDTKKPYRLSWRMRAFTGLLCSLRQQHGRCREQLRRTVCPMSPSLRKPVLTSFIGKKSVESAMQMLMKNDVPNYEYPEEAVSLHTMQCTGTMLGLKNQGRHSTHPMTYEKKRHSIFEKVRTGNREST